MKNRLVTLGVVAAFVGVLLYINRHEPTRVSEQRKQEAAEAQRKLDEANAKGKPLNFREAVQKNAKKAIEQLAAKAAESSSAAAAAVHTEPFQVEFLCSNGTFVVEINPEWSPLGAAQFRAAVEDGVYNDARFFRVIPGFVVQWGIPADPEKTAKWENKNLQDEPEKTPNARGTITYAKTQAPNSRTIQVFINIGDNTSRLARMGFAPFGTVIKGLEVVDGINSQYLQEPDQAEIETRGNAYLKEHFPKLDYIKEAKVLGTVAPAAPATPLAEAAPSAASPVPAPAQSQ